MRSPRGPGCALEAIVLIAAPFVGEGGWPSEEFELPKDLGARLPHGARVHVFHGLRDETVPPSHADLYAQVIPQARVHRLPGRDHQLNNDLSDVAKAIGCRSAYPAMDWVGPHRCASPPDGSPPQLSS
jgi:hypothetical protein